MEQSSKSSDLVSNVYLSGLETLDGLVAPTILFILFLFRNSFLPSFCLFSTCKTTIVLTSLENFCYASSMSIPWAQGSHYSWLFWCIILQGMDWCSSSCRTVRSTVGVGIASMCVQCASDTLRRAGKQGHLFSSSVASAVRPGDSD